MEGQTNSLLKLVKYVCLDDESGDPLYLKDLTS